MTGANDRPLVSVVMAVRNRADYLPQALASVRWQTLPDWECVCIDDGSTDATPEVLARFAAADPRIRVLRQPPSGVAAALTLGDGTARGDWIARMDSDDIALPQRLERQLDYVRRHPDCVGLGADVVQTDPGGAPLGRVYYPAEHREIERRMLAGVGETIAHPTLFYRRDAIQRIGGYREQYEAAHDADFLARLATTGRLTNLPEVLLLYRQHANNFCRVRRAEIDRQLAGVVREAHEARGLTPPADPQRSSVDREASPLVSKWARRAARNGLLGTATRLAAQQATAEPFSWNTTRMLAEVAFRGAVAVATGRRNEPVVLPDWRAWDCTARRAA